MSDNEEMMDDMPLFPVAELEYGEGIIFVVAPDDETQETAELCKNVEALLNEKIEEGPSQLTAADLIETGEYDLLYADAASMIEDAFGEEAVEQFGVLNAFVVDQMIIVNCSLGNSELMFEDDGEYDAESSDDDGDWD